MLCQSLLYSQVTQLHTDRHFLIFFFLYIFIFYLTRGLSVPKRERPITQPIWVGDIGSNIPKGLQNLSVGYYSGIVEAG